MRLSTDYRITRSLDYAFYFVGGFFFNLILFFLWLQAFRSVSNTMLYFLTDQRVPARLGSSVFIFLSLSAILSLIAVSGDANGKLERSARRVYPRPGLKRVFGEETQKRTSTVPFFYLFCFFIRYRRKIKNRKPRCAKRDGRYP